MSAAGSVRHVLNGSVPPFDLGPAALVVARGITVACLVSAAGSAVFACLLAGAGGATAERTSRRLAFGSIAAAALAMPAWLLLEAANMAGAGDLADAFEAARAVLLDTRFGQVLLAQLVILAAAALALWSRRKTLRLTGAGFCVLALAMQAGHSHALAMANGFSPLVASDTLHLTAAGLWLGGLVPLLILVRTAPLAAAQSSSRRFSALATACVLVLGCTAFYQGWELVGGLAGFIGTAYGWMAIVKAALFAVLLVLAAANRFRLTPALSTVTGPEARRWLLRSIAAEVVFGLLVVAAAAALSSLPPAMHVQPVWPFDKRPSLETISEDADFRREALEALAALSAAILIAAAGLFFRRVRLPALVAGAVIAWFAVPRLDLLFVEAYPTSFYRSPTGFTAASIADGAALFRLHCAACHGQNGTGDGPLASGLPVPPADLTAGHLWAHSDGELFWWLTQGIEAPEGGAAMPGFAGTLSETQRWDLIDYVRANNAGQFHQRTGQWWPPLRAPAFEAQCAGGRTFSTDQFRGSLVELIFGAGSVAVPTKSEAGVNILAVHALETASGAGSGCRVGDPAVRLAYATIGGVAPDALLGTVFLIDPQGWVRAKRSPGESEDVVASSEPSATARLLAEIQEICRHPIREAEQSHAHHH